MKVVFVHGALVFDGAWWWHRMVEPLAALGLGIRAVELPSCVGPPVPRVEALGDAERRAEVPIRTSTERAVSRGVRRRVALRRTRKVKQKKDDIGEGSIRADRVSRGNRARRARREDPSDAGRPRL